MEICSIAKWPRYKYIYVWVLFKSNLRATACRKCPDHMKEEINEYISKKKEIKEQRNLIVDIDAEDYGIKAMMKMRWV